MRTQSGPLARARGRVLGRALRGERGGGLAAATGALPRTRVSLLGPRWASRSPNPSQVVLRGPPTAQWSLLWKGRVPPRGGCLSICLQLPASTSPRGQRNPPRWWTGDRSSLRHGEGVLSALGRVGGRPDSERKAPRPTVAAQPLADGWRLPRPFPQPPGVNPAPPAGVWGSGGSREPREGSGEDTDEREGVAPRDALP